MQGTIHRLIRGKGFGFIQTEARQYFFHHTEVRGIEFRQLAVGDIVEFQPIEEAEGKNPRAVEVLVVVKAAATARPMAPAAVEQAPAERREAPRPASPARRPTASRGSRPARPRPVDNFGQGLYDGGSTRAGVDEGPSGESEFSEELTPYDDNAREPISTADDTGEYIDEFATGPDASPTAPTSPGRQGTFSPGSYDRGPPSGRRFGRPSRPDGGGARKRPSSSSSMRGRPQRSEEKSRRPRASGHPGERGQGVVRSINIERGFGFIETASGDIFFHKSNVREGFESLDVGSRVAFVFGEGDRGAKAEDVSAV